MPGTVMLNREQIAFFFYPCCRFRWQEVKGTLYNSWARIGEFHHYLERQEQGQQDYLLSYTHSNK